jgi:HEAT repeat protein
MAAGQPALPALRDGLRHPEPMVRRVCTAILDHLVDEESIPDLVAALDDPDVGVCRRALHALACDQCKENACRPGEGLWVPRALEFMRDHPSADVRAGAIDALGKVVRHRPDVAAALAVAAETERDAGLRAMAHRLVARVPAPTG